MRYAAVPVPVPVPILSVVNAIDPDPDVIPLPKQNRSLTEGKYIHMDEMNSS